MIRIASEKNSSSGHGRDGLEGIKLGVEELLHTESDSTKSCNYRLL